MAASNVQIVRNALDAYSGRDAEQLLAYLTEDIELRSAIIGSAENNIYRGHDGIREWTREGDELFETLELELPELRDEGPLVVGLGSIRARGGGSGLALDSPTGWVFWLRDGLICAMHGYLEHEAALVTAREAAK